MSGSPHLAELEEKHRLLEQMIEEELARPAVDSIKVNSLKLEKLRLKDEMARGPHDLQHARHGEAEGISATVVPKLLATTSY